jgi:putative PIN family toxin of toxin-antitoxin system
VPARKDRVRVVLDTNVFVGFYLSRSPRSVNAQVIRLWRDLRQLQLIVSDPVIEEYLEVLQRLGVEESRVQRFTHRLRARSTVTHVNLGPRFLASRDPEDNPMLATAHAGRAVYLVTNDRDLLDIPEPQRRPFRFRIVTPRELLDALSE